MELAWLVLDQFGPILDHLDIIEEFRTKNFEMGVKYHEARLSEINDKCLVT